MKPYARRKSRALALQAIYQWQFDANNVKEIEAQYLTEVNPRKVDVPYFCDLLNGVVKERKNIDEIIVPFLDRKLKDLNGVERAALRLAVYELIHHLDVPHKVIINESLELTKKFGSIDGYKYVNGVLDKIIHASSVAGIRHIK